MADTKYPQYYIINQDRLTKIENNSKQRKTPNNLRQDKRGFVSTCTASIWPACSMDEWHVRQLGGFSSQSQNIHSERKALEQLTLWVQPIVKEWTLRRAAEEGLSVSSFASPLYEQAAQGSIDLQYSPQLNPIIEKTIRKEIRRAVKLLINTSQDAQMGNSSSAFSVLDLVTPLLHARRHIPGLKAPKLPAAHPLSDFDPPGANRLRKAPEESSAHQPTQTPDAAPNTPQRRFGKSADPAWTKITILMRRTSKREVRRRLEDEGEGRDLSTLVDELLTEWLGK